MAEPIGKQAAARLGRHRGRQKARGWKRVELSIPQEDAGMLREVATALRAGGERAARLRASLRPLVGPRQARTGDELLAFFRSSPFVAEDLAFDRDRSPPRPMDL